MEDTDTSEATDDGRSTLRRAANVVGLLVLLAVVVPFVLFAVPQLVGAQQSYVVLSGSMSPTLEPGDAILVERVEPTAIEEGDIVTFGRSSESTPTTHRVVEVVERDGGLAFRTKGDNNENVDPALVSPSQVRGRIASLGGQLLVIPQIGRVVLFAQTTLGFALLVVLPIVLLIGSEVWSFVASTRSGATDQSSAAPSSGGDAAAEGSDTAGSEEEEAAYTLAPTELRLAVVVGVLFVAYAVGVAYVVREVWAASIAASVATGVALLAGLYFLGGQSDDEETSTAIADPTVADGGAEYAESPAAGSTPAVPGAPSPEADDESGADESVDDTDVTSSPESVPADDGDDGDAPAVASQPGAPERREESTAGSEEESNEPTDDGAEEGGRAWTGAVATLGRAPFVALYYLGYVWVVPLQYLVRSVRRLTDSGGENDD